MDFFRCGHPRSPENTKPFGKQRGCLCCFEHRAELRRQETADARALLAEKLRHARGEGMTTMQIADKFSVSLSTVQRLAPESAPAFTKDPLFHERAIRTAAALILTKPAELIGPLRHKSLVRARWAVMMAMHKRGVSFCSIGRRFKRDHSTVMYAVAQGKYELGRSESFRDLFQRVDAA